MPDDLTMAEVERIAALARLALTDDEKALYAAQLARILDYARQVAELDTRDVPPTAAVAVDAPPERPDARAAVARAASARCRTRPTRRPASSACRRCWAMPDAPRADRARDPRRRRARDELSAVDVCRSCLSQIDAARPDAARVHHGRPRGRAGARRGARPSASPRARACRSPACPVAVKDNLCTAGIAHDRRLADPRRLRPALRRHRGRPALGGRRRHRRQDQLRRVRDGVVHRALRVRSVAQPVGPGPHAGRVERRVGGRGGRRLRPARARLGHRRVGPAAGRVLRRRRAEADLRARLALRPDRLRLVARPGRPVRPRRWPTRRCCSA